jgi:hypothetical protein
MISLWALSWWNESLHWWHTILNICPVTFVFRYVECLSLYGVVYNTWVFILRACSQAIDDKYKIHLIICAQCPVWKVLSCNRDIGCEILMLFIYLLLSFLNLGRWISKLSSQAQHHQSCYTLLYLSVPDCDRWKSCNKINSVTHS